MKWVRVVIYFKKQNDDEYGNSVTCNWIWNWSQHYSFKKKTYIQSKASWLRATQPVFVILNKFHLSFKKTEASSLWNTRSQKHVFCHLKLKLCSVVQGWRHEDEWTGEEKGGDRSKGRGFVGAGLLLGAIVSPVSHWRGRTGGVSHDSWTPIHLLIQTVSYSDTPPHPPTPPQSHSPSSPPPSALPVSLGFRCEPLQRQVQWGRAAQKTADGWI